ncbi:NUDIX domain-containing protein [Nocardioides sp.]|uniref:NUDIX domain-containing protein n=1 Tax=Nocardioides sp. TaxID=35761 RepID=UPI0027345921|nr:NUDIX domain-containing protein [Nocardioides sp.]MDP3894467.1 NUDIX domain-containing protein [Nocardioides sp.]
MHRFASVILVDRRGWILLQERDEHPVIDPEKWGFSGGHVEDGEEFLAAAYRELAEETGVKLDDGLTLWREVEVFHAAYDSMDRVQVFAAATTLTDDDLVCNEGRRICFVDPAVVPTLDLTTAGALALPDFLASSLYRDLKEQP